MNMSTYFEPTGNDGKERGSRRNLDYGNNRGWS
jgi:hypothetical protein